MQAPAPAPALVDIAADAAALQLAGQELADMLFGAPAPGYGVQDPGRGLNCSGHEQ